MLITSGAGRLGKDPELSYSKNGTAVCKFSVCCRAGKDSEWLAVVAFGKIGEVCSKHLFKGSLIAFSARQETAKYEKDGHTQYYTSFILKDITFLSKSRNSDSSSSGINQDAQYAKDDYKDADTDGDLPF